MTTMFLHLQLDTNYNGRRQRLSHNRMLAREFNEQLAGHIHENMGEESKGKQHYRQILNGEDCIHLDELDQLTVHFATFSVKKPNTLIAIFCKDIEYQEESMVRYYWNGKEQEEYVQIVYPPVRNGFWWNSWLPGMPQPAQEKQGDE